MEQVINLWKKVGDKCLMRASDILYGDGKLSMEKVELVKRLVDITVAIDNLNLQWEVQTQPDSFYHRWISSHQQI